MLLAVRMVMIVMMRMMMMMMLEIMKIWIPIGYLVKKNLLMTTIYCLKMKMMGTVHLALATAKRNTCYLTHVSISC